MRYHKRASRRARARAVEEEEEGKEDEQAKSRHVRLCLLVYFHFHFTASHRVASCFVALAENTTTMTSSPFNPIFFSSTNPFSPYLKFSFQ
uniref:Uncharacterized protein n=1 Tax=Caenorhabditis japonica TaxID=281687 RepID=A0A8R1IQA2_CAEJA